MNNFCIDLNFSDIPLFKNKVFLYKLKTKRHCRIDTSEISLDIHSIFDKLGLEIVFAESFFKVPFQPNPIHKDAPGHSDATKINWVYGGEGSTMNWYIPKNESIKEQQDINSIGVQYSYFNQDDLNLIHSQFVRCPSIVQVGIPHNVTVGYSHRHCISAFFKYKENNEYVKFADSINLFKDYICGGS